jgi:O-antigen biosynthesis protein WbqV
MKITRRASAAFAHDLVMAALSFILSLFLRVGGDITQYSPNLLLIYDLGFTATAAAVFLWAGL